MSTEKPKVVKTAKGSTFFVDLQKLIKEEDKKEKQMTKDKQINGTALFIPFNDKKGKNREKTNNDHILVARKDETLNRTFTKEDVTVIRNVVEEQKNSNMVERSWDENKLLAENETCYSRTFDINIQPVLQRDEVLTPLARLESLTGQQLPNATVKLKSTINKTNVKRNVARSQTIAKTESPVKDEEQYISFCAYNTMYKTSHWQRTSLPNLPKWAAGKNVSLDSTILNLKPFPEPIADTQHIQQTEQEIQIEDMFPTENVSSKRYVTAILPSISRVASAKSSTASKTSPSILKRKKKHARNSTDSTKNLNTQVTKNSKSTKTVYKKKVKKIRKENTRKKDELLRNNQTCINDASVVNIKEERKDENDSNLSFKTQRHGDGISELYEFGSPECLLSESSKISSLSKKNDHGLVDEHLQLGVYDSNMKTKENAESIRSLSYHSESDKLVASLEKTLSIDSIGDTSVEISPRKKMLLIPHNNFLSKISEEHSQSTESAIKDKSGYESNNLGICQSPRSILSVKTALTVPTLMSVDNDNEDFEELTRLVFHPCAVPRASSSLEGRTHDSSYDDYSSYRQYLRSVLGSCRSVYSPSSSEASCIETEEIIEWQKGKIIGRGAFGIVYQGLTSRAQLIAVKEVQIGNAKNKRKTYQKLEDEISILKGLHHRNVVKFIGTALDGDAVFIFMEYVAGGSLAGLISSFGPLKETIFQRYTKQLMSAVFYLHTERVVHRDIKGANILITVKGIIKLIDFGCAKELSLSLGSTVLLKSVKGTPYWMAPEVIQGTGVKSCGDCCGSYDVYINIFQSNSNIPYVLQGVRLTQNGNGSITTTGKHPNLLHTTDFTKMNKNEIVEILKKYLPIDLHHAVTSLLTNKKLLNDNLIKIHTKKHQVGDDSRSTKRHRKQRSVADFRETSAENSEFLQLAHLAGCSRFLKAVTKHHLIDVLLRTKHVVIFCPTDDAMENIMQSKSLTNEKQFLLNHIALNFRGSETMLKTFFKDGRIMLSLRHNGNSQLLWHANDVPILYSMKTINHRQIFVIKDFLQKPTKTIQNVLKENADLSMFYNLWRRIPLTKLTRSINIQKLCFAKNVCISITRYVKKHLENALRFKKFTVVIPTNSVLSKRSNKFLEAIAKNTWELRQLLLEHIYLGLLDEKSPHFNTSVSLSSNHFVIVTGQHNNKMVLLTASGNILNVKQSVTVKEGIIHIIDSTEE